MLNRPECFRHPVIRHLRTGVRIALAFHVCPWRSYDPSNLVVDAALRIPAMSKAFQWRGLLERTRLAVEG